MKEKTAMYLGFVIMCIVVVILVLCASGVV